MDPDRSKSDYYCPLCHTHMNSMEIWTLHVAGSRHQKNMKKRPWEGPSKVKNLKVDGVRPSIQDMLDEHEGTLIGLSYISERQAAVDGGENIYHCHLCQGSCTKINLIEHLETTKHKLLFFKQREPEIYSEIQTTTILKKANSLPRLVDYFADRWERMYGREMMEVELRKPVNWQPPSKRHGPPEPWTIAYRSGHDVVGRPRDSPRPSASSASARASEARRIEPEKRRPKEGPVSPASAKKSFERFSLERKIDLVTQLVDELSYDTRGDRAESFRVYVELSKVCLLPQLRSLPKELKKRLFRDLTSRSAYIGDVASDLATGRRSYYTMAKPDGS